MTTNTLFELIKKLPKAELHLHLEGAVTPSLLEKLEEEHSSGETSKISTVEYGESFSISDRQSLEDARKRILQNLRKPKEYLLPLEEIIRGMKEHNIVYSEVFFSPVHRWRLGLEAEKVLELLLERSSQAEKEEGRSIRWILTCSKSHGPDIARKTVDLAIRYREKGIVAVGLDASGSPDSGFDPEEYARIFAWAKVQGLFIHVHSGESDSPEDVVVALEKLGANRIGHGIQAARDPQLMQYLKDRTTGLDICLSGNALTGAWKHTPSHPFSLLWKRGVPVSLCTDSPGIFGCSLSGEMEIAVNRFKLATPDLKKLCLKSVSLSFLPYKEKMSLMQKFSDQISEIFTALK